MEKEAIVTKGAPFRLSWPAIFGGSVVSTALWLLLVSLGWAIGISALKPTELQSIKGVTLGSGLWSFIAPIVALFIGGMVAARSAGFATRVSAAIHGSVVWGLTSLVAFLAISSVLASVVGGALKVGGAAVKTAANAAPAAGDIGAKLSDTLGVSANDMLGPINQRLAAQGKPQITADQLQAALKDSASKSIKEGRVDRDILISSLAQNTALSRSDVEQVAGTLDQKMNQALGGVARAGEKAVDVTRGALWVWFGSMFLSLLAAIFGGILGVTRRQRSIEPFVGVAPGVPLGPGREVYP